ncbi:V-type proton ATPase subunit H-like protein [Emericellopsis cladophorae]|uniref:V-type proton ATPase subunit H n=1 Tax=Emericellopsis cladophorae TaxID=2686198 RepID=A0A9Q0BI93_9HYPO|nr:V-type proton ATPase subunit H-like protein [Emericellopsis cladophorae]KAI6786006.1 V-type proton ATPase subunit H-like protein [Emericellopsis cladophorae]
MSLDPPTYLASLQSNIRQRPIPWDGAVRAGTLSEDHYTKIRAVDKAKKPEQRKEIVQGDLDGYRLLFVGGAGKPSVIESAAQHANVIQYILVLLSDLLDDVPSLAKALFKDNTDPYRHFLPLLKSSNTEDAIPLLTAHALASLMATARDESQATHQALPMMFSYLSSLAKSTDAGLQDIAVLEYSSLLFGHVSRHQFWDHRSETIAPLIKILQTAAGVGSNGNSSASLWSGNASVRSTGFEGSLGGGVGLQLLYHVLLVVWQMSFEAAEMGDELNDEYDMIILYTQLLRLSPKEKTTRLIVSTLYNLLEKNQKSLLPTAVLARLPSTLENLTSRHLTDPDLLEDLEALKEMLDEYTKTKTTFDEYVAEVQSGHLRWSPPHRSSVFWAENARKILDFENGVIPRKLAEIMQQSWDNDKQVLAIACSDVGNLVKEVPEKRHQLEKVGLKRRIMELMQSEDENVRWESLRALGGWLKYSFEEMSI